MNQPNPNQLAQSRAAEVWQRFAGLFGAESLKRKYGTSPPGEWVGVLGRLDARELERGMRRLVHSGRDQLPTLPAFVRLCRSFGSDDINEGPSQQRPALPNPVNGVDAWLERANHHLLAHIMRCVQSNPLWYGRRESDEMHRAMTALVRAKNTWAEEMRDLAANQEGGLVDAELQKSCWADYINAAEREVAAIMKGE